MLEVLQPLGSAFAQSIAFSPASASAGLTVDQSTNGEAGASSSSALTLPHNLDLSRIVPTETANQPSLTLVTPANSSATIRTHASIRALLARTFKVGQSVSLTVDNATKTDVTAEVLDSKGEQTDIPVIATDDGETTQLTITPPVHFRPGKYMLKVTTKDGQVSTQDFSWGVLAINTNKSIYTPGEQTELAMAVLDDTGAMVCDADMTLQILSPTGQMTTLSTKDHSISVNDTCKSHDFTLTPDYQASFQPNNAGIYQMVLSAVTKNGTNTIRDSFSVASSVPFDVERITATRIYPPHTYPVTLKIKANQDFDGTVSEIVPDSFAISEPASSSAQPFDSTQSLSAYQDTNAHVLGASTQLAMPFDGSYPITEGFGEALTDPLLIPLYAKYGLAGHDGVDFAMPKGTPVLAADDGTVVLAEENSDYGTTVVIRHSWGQSYYGHLSKMEVTVGQAVKRGEEIALSGSTGESTGPHLHFGIKPNNPDMQNGYYGKIDPAIALGISDKQAVLGAATVAGVGNNIKQINWHITVKQGDEISLGYDYKAPNISPQLYTIGPASFIQDNKTVFQEQRQWQIAADAPSNILFMETPDALNGATGDGKNYFWGGGSAPTTTYDTSIKHSGNGSWQADGTGGSSSAFIASTGSCGGSGGRVSMYIYLDTTPTGSTDVLHCTSSGGLYVGIGINTSRQLLLTSNVTIIKTSSTTLSTGTWYRIALSYTVTSSTVNQEKVYLNGAEVTDLGTTNATLSSAGAASTLVVGVISTTGGTKMHLEDVYSDDDSTLTDPGDVRVTAKLPNATATNTFGTIVGTTSITNRWDNEDERPLNAANGWKTSSTAQEEDYGVQSASTGDVDLTGATIVGYGGWAYANRTSGGSSPTTFLVANGATISETVSTTSTLFATYVLSSSYPTGAFGFKKTAGSGAVQLLETGALIAYIPPSGGGGGPSGPTLDQLMRHGKWFNSSGVRQPFTF